MDDEWDAKHTLLFVVWHLHALHKLGHRPEEPQAELGELALLVFVCLCLCAFVCTCIHCMRVCVRVSACLCVKKEVAQALITPLFCKKQANRGEFPSKGS